MIRSKSAAAAVLLSLAACDSPTLPEAPDGHAAPSFSVTVGSEVRVSDGAAYYPAVSGSHVVYHDNRSGSPTLFLKDLNTGSGVDLTPGAGRHIVYTPSIDGNRVIWAEAHVGGLAVFLYDITTQETTVATPPHGTYSPRHSVSEPVIDGERIVWVEQSNEILGNYGEEALYLLDLATGEERELLRGPSNTMYQPDLSGDWVVWRQYEAGANDIVALNVSTNELRQITDDPDLQLSPKVEGTRVIYVAPLAGSTDRTAIYAYDLESGASDVHSLGMFVAWPEISGELVTFQAQFDIWVLDLADGAVTQVTTHPAGQSVPDVSGGWVVWQDRRVPEYEVWASPIQRRLDPPVADAGPDLRVLVTRPATFDGTGSADPDGAIVAYDWDFGDGVFGSGSIVEHSYTPPGHYAATLTVTDEDGLSGADQADVTVITPSEAIGDLLVHLDDLVTAGVLEEQDANGLIRKLEQSRDLLAKEKPGPATRKLADFADQVNALVQSGRLPAPDAQLLIEAAAEIIDVLLL